MAVARKQLEVVQTPGASYVGNRFATSRGRPCLAAAAHMIVHWRRPAASRRCCPTAQ